MANSPAIPRPDFGIPVVQKTSGGPAFGARETEASQTIVLHVKILTPDPVERLACARLLETQLKGQRVASKDITYVVTDDEVSMMLSDTTALAAKITADVMRRLGIA